MVYPPEDGYPSSTNRARRALTLFMRRTPLATTPRRGCVIYAWNEAAAAMLRVSNVSVVERQREFEQVADETRATLATI